MSKPAPRATQEQMVKQQMRNLLSVMIDSLVGVMDADVTAHGFEHYLLWDEVQLSPRFGYEVQFVCTYIAQYVVPFMDEAFGVS